MGWSMLFATGTGCIERKFKCMDQRCIWYGMRIHDGMQMWHAAKICHWNVQLERGFEVFVGLVVIPDLYDSNPNFKLYLKKVVLLQSSSSSRNVWWRNWGSRCIKVYKFVSDKEGKKNWFVVEILSSSSYDQVFLKIQGFSTFSLFTFDRQCG